MLARRLGIVGSERRIGDETARAPDLVHDAVAGIDAERAGDAGKLLAVADVDAHRAYRHAGIAVDAVTGLDALRFELLAMARARLAPPVIVGDYGRLCVE